MVVSSILGSLLGFAGSALGPIGDYFQAKEAGKQEIARLKVAAAMADKGYEHEKIMAAMQAGAKEHDRLIQHDIEISKGKGFIAGVQKSVRPVITYSFFGLFVWVKVVTVSGAMASGASWIAIVPILWDDGSQAMFAAVISFWFGQRYFEKKRDANGGSRRLPNVR